MFMRMSLFTFTGVYVLVSWKDGVFVFVLVFKGAYGVIFVRVYEYVGI